MTAALNVNIGARHDSPECEPINIPCPIPPTFEVTVRLGECQCAAIDNPNRHPDSQLGHIEGCPARPIRVTCSISGKTWEESGVVDIEPLPDLWGANANLRAIARDRWTLVKALVTGKNSETGRLSVQPQNEPLFAQRDAVFAALCEMARCERAYWEAAKAVYLAFPQAHVSSDMQVVDPGDPDGDAPSSRWLAAYVERLIEQVGVL